MRILVTGAAGFIGSSAANQLLELGHQVIGLDNVNDYYSRTLKRARITRLQTDSSFEFIEGDVCTINETALPPVDRVIHLAAQAGVRHSIDNPDGYTHSNLLGFAQVLEYCRQNQVEHLCYASSSSVYGSAGSGPFSTSDRTDRPVSYYAATKKANELMAESYSHLYDLPATGLRFFTVYGPWGRPDMAVFSFSKAILERKSIQLYGMGELRRDYTYIDDIVDGLTAACMRVPTKPSKSESPHKILNLGNGNPVTNGRMVAILEKEYGIKARVELLGQQPGDVEHTFADIAETTSWCGYQPKVNLEEGLQHFANWYREYYSTGHAVDIRERFNTNAVVR